MKNYYRIMPGAKSAYAETCRNEGFIGTNFGMDIDLSGQFPDNWKEFNKKYIPEYLNRHPEKSKVSAGLACGAIWTVSYGIKKGEIILSPDGQGSYMIGEVDSSYFYKPDGILPHRRKINWYPETIARNDMSQSLKNSTGSIGTVSNVTEYAEEIEQLLQGKTPPALVSTDETIEDPTVFGLEKHLEEFLISNWEYTELAKKYDIYSEDGELIGQQFPSDTGPIDILCISKDKKELLVIELKKGRASDLVVGQIQRYMGYVKEELSEEGQQVKGIIIALEDDLRIKRALSVANNIEFYRYQVSFRLFKG